MGWSIGYDDKWNRDIGYGVPCLCDQPKCNKEIDRGLSYVCGNGQPYGGDDGCGLYFCENHGGGSLCSRCRNRKPPHVPKEDLTRWIVWKATDNSWEDWRKTHRKEVPYVIYVSQGMGGGPEEVFWTLEAALKYVEEHEHEASFAIRQPNGKWYNWSKHVNKVSL